MIGDSGGQPREKEEKRAIFEVVRRHGLERNVTFLGFQPYERLLAEASRHQIFLSPSLVADDGDSEGGLPVTIIEMAATGMPVVSARHCDIPDVVLDGVTGRLANEGDANDLTEQLNAVVSDPDSWPAMGAAARLHVERRYDVRVLATQLAERYARLAAS